MFRRFMSDKKEFEIYVETDNNNYTFGTNDESQAKAIVGRERNKPEVDYIRLNRKIVYQRPWRR